MRGGTFNFKKFESYQQLMFLLWKFDVVDKGTMEEGEFEPNPLIRAQSLFVDPHV